MLFNSLTFLVFLVVVFGLYWFVFRKNLWWQNLFLVVVSYIFYGWWDWRFLFLIALTSLCSWASGLGIEYYRDRQRPGHAKAVLVMNLVLNLGILAFFKYFNFFVSSFISAFAFLGLQLHATSLHIILPVGISFYTFQALSYSIDVYRKNIEPTKDVVAFFAFVSFFPQLVAGPIERATNLLPQFFKARHFDHAQAVNGMRQILWGFFKKVVIADNCAVYVNAVFDSYGGQSGSTLVLAAVFFAFQIYGDFSGYSDIAIGVGRLFGFSLMRNFNYPYFSRDVAEFWRRWHISLSTWFRDYVYIPLGGSRSGKWCSVRNTLIVFLVSGLWHGANWTFVAWGLFHGLLFLPLLLLHKNRKFLQTVAEGRLLPTPREVLEMAVTFALVTVGWILFRAPSITDAFQYMAGICDWSLFSLPLVRQRSEVLGTLIICLPFLCITEWFQRTRQFGLDIGHVKSRSLR